MGIMEDVAGEQALESVTVRNATGEDAFVQRAAGTIAGGSQTMEEACLTAFRIGRGGQPARGSGPGQRRPRAQFTGPAR